MDSSPTETGGVVWQIRLLGRLSACRAGLEIAHFQTQKTAVLLAYLACFLHRRHTREELIDLLWPDAEPDAGRNRLSQALGWLRRHLEPTGVPQGSVLHADRLHIG